MEEEDSMKSRLAGEDGWSAGGSRGDSLASGYLGYNRKKDVRDFGKGKRS